MPAALADADKLLEASQHPWLRDTPKRVHAVGASPATQCCTAGCSDRSKPLGSDASFLCGSDATRVGAPQDCHEGRCAHVHPQSAQPLQAPAASCCCESLHRHTGSLKADRNRLTVAGALTCAPHSAQWVASWVSSRLAQPRAQSTAGCSRRWPSRLFVNLTRFCS
jgi:hypothetical protein